jgi:hypothetical protein
VTAPPTPHDCLIYFFFNYYKMFRANTGYTSNFGKRGGGGGGGFLPFLLMLMLFCVFVLVVGALVYLRSRQRQQQAKTVQEIKSANERLSDLQQQLGDHKSNVYAAGSEYGLTEEDIDNELLTCLVYPENGVCDTTFYELKDGCCKLKNNVKELNEQHRREFMNKMLLEVGVTIMAEILITSVLPRIGKTMLAKINTKALARVLGRVAKSCVVKLSVKLTAMTARILVKLGSGPVGWALLIFDIISIALDLADTSNYSSFLENKMNLEMRDVLVYKFYEAIKMDGGDFPVLFPYSLLFPDEAAEVAEEVNVKIFTDYMLELTEVEGGTDYLVSLLTGELEAEEAGTASPQETAEETQEGLTVMEKFFDRVREKHHLKLDKYTFDLLQDKIPQGRQSDLVFVESLSTKSSVGIAISEQAAIKWNNDKRTEWFTYLDPFFPPNIPEPDWVPPLMAVYTNKYLAPNLINPGTENQPNLTYKTLPQKVTLAYPFGPLVTNCEKPRTSAKYKEPVDPREFGVSFNPIEGVCNFTRNYCERYGIDFKNKTWKDTTKYTDCELSGEQEVLEAIFGTTITRKAKEYWNNPAAIPADMRDTYNQRKERYGEAAAVALSFVDPLGIGEGIGLNIQEQLAGRDKYCITGDTCKYFTAKHNGGNFMSWSARDSSGQIYPPQLGFQNQVKHGEDHTFYVPEGGYFRVKCSPGEGRNFSYDEIPENGRKNFTCWAGKVNKPLSVETVVEESVEALADVGETIAGGLGTAAEETGEFIEDVGQGLEDFFSDRRLKTNIRRINVQSPIRGLNVYIWDWNEIAMSTYGLKGRDIGFIADEIDDKYVSKDGLGFEFIRPGTPVSNALIKFKSQYNLK